MIQYIVDAFADEIFHGNPAAVCCLGQWPDDKLMQAIAGENNLSETAFVVGRAGEYHLRWFTPEAEIDFCGHATVAAAFVIANLTGDSAREIVFHTKSGKFLAQVDGTRVAMDFPAYTWREIAVTEAMAEAIGVMPRKALLSRDLVMVVDSAEQVKNLTPDMGKLEKIPGLTRAVTATAPENSPYDCISRVFAPELGCPEDPVTGSTHCLIAPYWAKQLEKTDITAYQASRRGGVLRCAVHGDRVKITADAILFSEARIYPHGCVPGARKQIVSVRLEPDGPQREMPRPKTAAQLLSALSLREETALVIRDGQLLTPDCHIWPGDDIIVRKSGSRG